MNEQNAQIVTATRELVDGLLAINTKNRNLRKTIIEEYAGLIKEGKWMLTNNGIGISGDGVLIDGQHRLEAIRAAGYPPVKFVLVRGLLEESQKVVDQHARRTARDALRLVFNIRVARAAPAICSIIERDSTGWKPGRINILKIIEILEEYKEEIETVCNAPISCSFFAAPYLAAAAVMMKSGRANFDQIYIFLRAVESGEGLERGSPILLLRNYILTNKKVGGNAGAQKTRFIRALNAISKYLNGETCDKLYEKDPR